MKAQKAQNDPQKVLEEMERERLRELNLAARESLEIEGEW